MSVIEYNMRIFVCLSVGSFRALYQEVVIQICFLKLLLRYVYIYIFFISEKRGNRISCSRTSPKSTRWPFYGSITERNRSKQSVLWWTGVMKCQIISASCSVAKNYSYNLPIICFLVILSFLWGLHIKLACNNFESYFLRLGSSKINATAIGIFCVKNLCFNGLMSICQSI